MPPENHLLETARLTLVPSDPRQLTILYEGSDEALSIAGFRVADELRRFYASVKSQVSAQWLAGLRASAPDPWHHGFFLAERSRGEVIGTAGFKGPPDADGMVEIAYGVVPSVEGRGYATEAAGALVRFAAAEPRVRTIRAHTLPELNASTRVLRKCGFVHTGEVVDPDDGPVWRWERNAHHIGTP
ncbi:MAG TPA: GNAT family N-acetyltransferase [Gemmatimonadales bacterium]|nr:GNAT family N-acetyltransferase [Gemmatimonadales bacterium]